MLTLIGGGRGWHASAMALATFLHGVIKNESETQNDILGELKLTLMHVVS